MSSNNIVSSSSIDNDSSSLIKNNINRRRKRRSATPSSPTRLKPRRSSNKGNNVQINYEILQYIAIFFMVLSFACLLIFSFWPIFLIAVPFRLLSVIFALIAAVILYSYFFHRTKFIAIWAWFLLPWHAIFLTVFIAAWSFWWSISIGAFFFLQGELRWDRENVIYRWESFISYFDGALSKPIFEYFPMKLHLPQNNNKLNDLIERHNIHLDEEHEEDDANEDTIDENTVTTNINDEAFGKGKIIFAYHPHGVYAFGLFSLVFGISSGFQSLFPNSKGVLVGVANALLHIPVLGTFFAYFGFVPASKKSLNKACETDFDIVVVPGGIAEMTKFQPDKEVLYLRKRYGFIRLAMKHGRTIVPMYGFGENNTFQQYSCLKQLREKLSRRFKLSLVLFRGRGYTLIPFRTPLNIVFGTPLELPKVENPSNKLVEKYLDKYVRLVEQLYYEHRGKYETYENKDLEIL